ncbi:dedicator of cytokinesis protein [Anaeramoeba flamelloides]|uniref:Dedicator of cytokinesis protein n=1 Tax=Anaeramoeba flamelloides TaxID=1746091 RepID=A0AAV7Z455_9EUKA|nr:dedicator of cytokinesis protein [Anaeramoeba flamelloides]
MKSISNNKKIRIYSNSILYLLLKNGYSTAKNFNYIKIQMVLGFSKLVGDLENFTDDRYTKYTLRTIQGLSNIEKTIKGNNSGKFKKEISDHCQNMFSILKDSVELRDHLYDPEKKIDLLYNIAREYKRAPQLRITWLESLIKFHTDVNSPTEAAIGKIHLAAMISEYLNKLMGIEKKTTFFDETYIPLGYKDFENISISVREEATNLSITEIQNLCQSSIFSENKLIQIIKEAVELFRKEKLYELISECYKLLIPIYEENSDFENVSLAHEDLKNCFDEMIQLEFYKSTRTFANYWKIGFFGLPFNENNGVEYIYKEKPGTTLGEIKDRLLGQYTKVFGKEKITVLTTSASIDLDSIKTELEEGKLFLQITSVTPYFDEKELLKRKTHFARTNNVSKFFYKIPFTKTGKKKSQGNVKTQWLKQVILIIDGQFPYIKKRLKIIKREENDLSPLQVSLNSIKQKNIQLKNELSKSMKDSKNLQGLLQGSLLITVNEGPFAVCKAFLGRNVDNYESTLIEELRHEFGEFVRLNELAVQENARLTTNEMRLFQDALEMSIVTLRESAAPYVKPGGPTEEELQQLEKAESESQNLSMKLQQELTDKNNTNNNDLKEKEKENKNEK